MNQEYRGLDRFRIVAAFLIVAIHTYPLSSVSQELNFLFTHVFARIAVPFFLIVTGYFVLAKPEFPAAFIKKTSLLYLAATLLYLPISIRAGHYQDGNAFIIFLRNLIFDGTFYHLWYLPAVIIGVLIIHGLRRWFSLKKIMVIAALLYLIGLFGDSYYGLASQIGFVKSAYDVIFAVSSYTRNGIFYAPLFLLIGAFVAGQKPKLLKRASLSGFLMPKALMLLLLMFLLAEGLTLNYFGINRHDSFYLSLVPLMYFLFQFLLSRRHDRASKKLSLRVLRDTAMWIYILHPLVIIAVRGFASLAGLNDVLVKNSLIHYFLVCLLSFLSALVISLAWKKWGGKLFTLERQTGQISGKPLRAGIFLNMENLRYNVGILQSHLPAGCQLMPAVKANAYGHGAVRISKELNACGIRAFCVMTVWEAIELRKHHVKGEILVLGYTAPELFALIRRYRLTQSVFDWEYAVLLNGSISKKVPVHIKIDTGMHRTGLCADDFSSIHRIFVLPKLQVTGIYTHLCVADSEKEKDITFSGQQAESFNQVLAKLKEKGIKLPKTHIQSSYGIMRDFYCAYDYARPGIALYGMLSTKDDTEKWGSLLKPVLSVKARVSMTAFLNAGEAIGYGLSFTATRKMKIALITIGYADGIPRFLSNKNGFAHVIINGEKAPIIGRICMDSLTVDVTDLKDVKSGDIAVIIGDGVTAADIAMETNTITNEILCRLGGRLER
ncbi:MAG: serine racemase VanT catalytic subunit [Lachnospiraceae bacterium]|nr:serine racemase VanT catalytic subunit [Lachnospiraceae bacterium]